MKTITLALLSTASAAQIALAVEHFQIVAAIAHVESGGRFDARGDYDKKSCSYLAHGAYQLHKDAWIMGGGSIDRWPDGAYDEVESTRVAMKYVACIERYLVKHDILATPANIYASYNCGPARFRNHFKASIKLCPKTTQKACAKLTKFILENN